MKNIFIKVPTPITPGVTSLTPVTITTATTAVAGQSSVQCYDCSGPNCGKEGSTLSMNCPSCMIYRNPDDQSKKLNKSLFFVVKTFFSNI